MPRGKKKKRVVETSPPPVSGRKRRGRAISHSPVRSPISPSSPKSTHSEEAEMVEQNNHNVSNHATPKLDSLGVHPLKHPNNHILNFLEICDAFKHNGVSDDAIRLRLFPFSLRDKAKVWLQSLQEGTSIDVAAGGALMSKPVDAAYTYFIVLDYEEDREVPIILGRPFLATGRTIIDVQKGELKMRVQDEEVTFNVFKAMKLPGEPEECFRVNVIESSIDSHYKK
ncbi:DNA-directed DNA polymerase [Senna tora]|uniref:DNA-directed DNA polymerase n=1 Tax=Senna tora TaxID=362788 RepID=A0A834SCD1_9FABA|nr:DNA-directed DNA polymerase [Senna tora]